MRLSCDARPAKLTCLTAHVGEFDVLDLKPTLRDDEEIIGAFGATVYQIAGSLVRSSNVRVWLTGQRLILKAALGPQRSLPLFKIASFREEKVSWYTMIRIEFTNGHLEWLTVQDQAQFLRQLTTAQRQAPQIPDEVVEAAVSPAIQTLFRGGLLMIATVAVVVLICGFMLVLILGALWLLSVPR